MKNALSAESPRAPTAAASAFANGSTTSWAGAPASPNAAPSPLSPKPPSSSSLEANGLLLLLLPPSPAAAPAGSVGPSRSFCAATVAASKPDAASKPNLLASAALVLARSRLTTAHADSLRYARRLSSILVPVCTRLTLKPGCPGPSTTAGTSAGVLPSPTVLYSY